MIKKFSILIILLFLVFNSNECVSHIKNKNVTSKTLSGSITISNIDSTIIGNKIIGPDFKKVLREYNRPKEYIYNYGVDYNTDSIVTIHSYKNDIIIDDCKILFYVIDVNYEDAEAQSLLGVTYDNDNNIIDSFIFYQRGYSPDIEEVISNTYIYEDKIELKTFIKDFYKNQLYKKTHYYKLKNNKFIKFEKS